MVDKEYMSILISTLKKYNLYPQYRRELFKKLNRRITSASYAGNKMVQILFDKKSMLEKIETLTIDTYQIVTQIYTLSPYKYAKILGVVAYEIVKKYQENKSIK